MGFRNVKIVGIGRGGTSAVNLLLGTGLHPVEFITMNTAADVQNLALAPSNLLLGAGLTGGLGTGGDPEIGMLAAEQDQPAMQSVLAGADLVLVTAAMGGGTGSGAALRVAEAARKAGALTAAIVSEPFHFEGPRRLRVASEGIDGLLQRADCVIVVRNDTLFSAYGKRTAVSDALLLADKALCRSVESVYALLCAPDQRAAFYQEARRSLTGAGIALLGHGSGAGRHGVVEAARSAVLSTFSGKHTGGALRILVSARIGPEVTTEDARAASLLVKSLCDPLTTDVTVAWVREGGMRGRAEVTLIATGFNLKEDQRAREKPLASPEGSSGMVSAPGRGSCQETPPVRPAGTGERNPRVRKQPSEEMDIPELLAGLNLGGSGARGRTGRGTVASPRTRAA